MVAPPEFYQFFRFMLMREQPTPRGEQDRFAFALRLLGSEKGRALLVFLDRTLDGGADEKALRSLFTDDSVYIVWSQDDACRRRLTQIRDFLKANC